MSRGGLFVIGNYIRISVAQSTIGRCAFYAVSRLISPHLFAGCGQKSLEGYSFDLKSATDRWPLSVIHDLMTMLWGPSLASSIVNGALGLNTVWVGPPLVRQPREIAFLAGPGLLRLLDPDEAPSKYISHGSRADLCQTRAK